MTAIDRFWSSVSAEGRVFFAVTAIFYLNNFGFIAARAAGQWLAVDYGSKVAMLGLILAVPATRNLAWRGGVRTARLVSTIEAIIAVFLLLLVAYTYWRATLARDPTNLQFLPRIEAGWLRITYLTFGLALTAVVEEFFWRRLYVKVVGPILGGSNLALYTVGTLIFAGGHWSLGVAGVVFAGVAGFLFLALLRGTGVLWPAMVAHSLTNLVIYW